MDKIELRVIEGGIMDKHKALEAALAQIDRAFGKGSVMRLGEQGQDRRDRGHLHRLAGPGHRARHRRPAQAAGSSRSTGRNARARPRSPCMWSPRRRRRAAPPPSSTPSMRSTRLRPQARRQPRRPAGLAAGHRRAGAGDHRHPGPLGRRRRHRDRLGGGADAAGRDRRRDGRQPARPAGPADEPGAAQAHRLDLQVARPW